VDRLTFGGNIIETGTDSYRLAQTRARADQHGYDQWAARRMTDGPSDTPATAFPSFLEPRRCAEQALVAG
jgi:hypothetical protein